MFLTMTTQVLFSQVRGQLKQWRLTSNLPKVMKLTSKAQNQDLWLSRTGQSNCLKWFVFKCVLVPCFVPVTKSLSHLRQRGYFSSQLGVAGSWSCYVSSREAGRDKRCLAPLSSVTQPGASAHGVAALTLTVQHFLQKYTTNTHIHTCSWGLVKAC